MALRLVIFAWWTLCVGTSLVWEFAQYVYPAWMVVEHADTALQARTWWGRAQLVMPDALWTLLLAPVVVAVVYRCGRRLPKSVARNSALAVGLILVGGAFAGAVLFTLGKQAHALPFRLLAYLCGM